MKPIAHAPINNVFDIAGRSMAAQLVRMNTIASNLANAGSLAGSPEEAYRSIRPVFETEYAQNFRDTGMSTTRTTQIVPLDREPEKVYMPDHPKADKDGFVYVAAVKPEEEMVDMLEANRQYQNNVEVVTTMRALMMRTINMGK
jgi:flagellar basal-body rod protein FlgC